MDEEARYGPPGMVGEARRSLRRDELFADDQIARDMNMRGRYTGYTDVRVRNSGNRTTVSASVTYPVTARNANVRQGLAEFSITPVSNYAAGPIRVIGTRAVGDSRISVTLQHGGITPRR